MPWQMSPIFLEIVLFNNGVSLSFVAHWLSQTPSHKSTANGRIKFLAILCGDLVRATLNATEHDAFNNFSFVRKDFVNLLSAKSFFYVYFEKRLRLVSKLRLFSQ